MSCDPEALLQFKSGQLKQRVRLPPVRASFAPPPPPPPRRKPRAPRPTIAIYFSRARPARSIERSIDRSRASAPRPPPR
jgi:hypothetical protein